MFYPNNKIFHLVVVKNKFILFHGTHFRAMGLYSIHKVNTCTTHCKGKGKGHAHNRSQGPKGVPGRLRPRIFLTFGTTRLVGRQSHAPAAFTPRRIPWYSFLEAESTPGLMTPSVATEKIPSVTPPGIDPKIVRLVAQCAQRIVGNINMRRLL
jgi:hypothetical protein